MAQINDDQNYAEIISSLNSLPSVSVPGNFEADLMRRINSGSIREESTWKRFFKPTRLIPTAGLAATAVLVLFVFNTGADESDNPLMMDPPVREDVIVSKTTPEMGFNSNQAEETPRGSLADTKSETRTVNPGTGLSNNYISAQNDVFISKSGLNFRNVRLNEAEIRELQSLKRKVINAGSGSILNR